jgi:hypothetical protein
MMDKKNEITFAILAFCCLSLVFTGVTAVGVSATSDNGNGDDNGNGESGIIDTKAKQPDKPKICQVKVQVKILNALNGTIYTVQLGELLPQSKKASFNQTEIDTGDNNVAFNFQFKKGGDACPTKGSTVLGNVNGQGFAAYINSLTKMNKVGVELS